ncbi:MAG: hypothetical protein KKF41_12080 [Actinobacteria bacterium]|nr:hypothetical protein [Actinomycetota bacterium]MBU1944329.1 hypothetical protein [Actinomycetota bacterium]MBU2688314.1 hypothetical protein [Actinomycetota bacterium]
MGEEGLGLRGGFLLIARTLSHGLVSLGRSPLAVGALLLPATAILLPWLARTGVRMPGVGDATPALVLCAVVAVGVLLILYGFAVAYLAEGSFGLAGWPRLKGSVRRFAPMIPTALALGVIVLSVSFASIYLMSRFMEVMVPDAARADLGGVVGFLVGSVLLGATVVPAAPLISPFLLGYHCAVYEGTGNPFSGVASGFRLFREVRWYPSLILAGVLVLAANGVFWPLSIAELLAPGGSLQAPAVVIALAFSCSVMVAGAGCFECVYHYSRRVAELRQSGLVQVPVAERVRRAAIGFLLFAAPFVAVWGYHRTRSMVFVPLLAAACLVMIALAARSPGTFVGGDGFDTRKARRAAVVKLSWPCVLLVAFIIYAVLNQNWRHLPGYALILAMLLSMTLLAVLHYRRLPVNDERVRTVPAGRTTITDWP